jgi:ubiquitin C-terminal hydrolase
MNDKTAIEDIAQVLSKAHKYFIDTDKDYDTVYLGMADYFVKNRLTIAALDAEKPGEDASSVVEQINDAMASVEEFNREELNEEEARNEWERRWREKASILIQHFAASYHAEQCKACKANTTTDNRICGLCGKYTTCSMPFVECCGKHWQPLPEAPLV